MFQIGYVWIECFLFKKGLLSEFWLFKWTNLRNNGCVCLSSNCLVIFMLTCTWMFGHVSWKYCINLIWQKMSRPEIYFIVINSVGIRDGINLNYFVSLFYLTKHKYSKSLNLVVFAEYISICIMRNLSKFISEHM